MTQPDNYLRGLAITGLGVLVLSPDGVLTRLVSADAWTLMFWRGLLMGLALSAYLLVRYRGGTVARVRAIGVPGLAVAVLFALSTAMFVTAIRTTTIANTLVILSVAPLFAAAFARLFLREPVVTRTWVAAALVVAGMAVIFADGLGRGSTGGNLAAVAAAAGWGGLLVILRRQRLDDPSPAIAIGALLLAACVWPIAPTLAIGGGDVVAIAVLGLFVLPVSFALITVGPKYLPAPEVALVMLAEAVLGPLWGWLLIAELPTATAVAGGAIVLGTLVVHSALALWRRPAPVAP